MDSARGQAGSQTETERVSVLFTSDVIRRRPAHPRQTLRLTQVAGPRVSIVVYTLPLASEKSRWTERRTERFDGQLIRS